jgi:hypothetical protein
VRKINLIEIKDENVGIKARGGHNIMGVESIEVFWSTFFDL